MNLASNPALPRRLSIALVLLAGALASCRNSSATLRPQRITVSSEGPLLRVGAGGEDFVQLLVERGSPLIVQELRAHGGRDVLREDRLDPRVSVSPATSADHPEHRSMWVGHGDVNGHDLWFDGPGGAIVTDHRLFAPREGRAEIVARLAWRDSSGKLLCNERRRFVIESFETVRFVTVEIELNAAGEDVVFGDTKDGFFALRLADWFRTAGNTSRAYAVARIGAEGDELVSSGASGASAGELWGVPARWIAHRAPIDGEVVNVVVFDHPENYGFPARWQVRPYGLVAANPFGVESFGGSIEEDRRGALALGPYEKVVLRYRVVLAVESMDAESIEVLWRQFAGSES